jgi:hypothetical protein
MPKKEKDTKMNTIKNVLHNNEYNTNFIENPPHARKQDTLTPQRQKTKWVTFTYSGKEVRRITKLFQDTRIKIASARRAQYKIY